MTRLIITVLVGLFVSGQAYANETRDFVKFFSINCVGTVKDLTALKSYANLMKWSAIPNESISMAGGKIDNSWGVVKEGQFFIIASGSSVMNDGRRLNSCAVLSKPHDADEVGKILKSQFKLKLRIDEVEGFRRTSQWHSNKDDYYQRR
jgi:hypothetical protein